MTNEELEKIVARHEILTEDQVTAVLEGKKVIARKGKLTRSYVQRRHMRRRT
jgi:hypothetical protein